MEDTFHLGIKALIRNSEGNFLLLQVNLAELKKHTGDAYWDIPGGRVQKGDSIEQTLQREVLEETGIKTIKAHTVLSTVVSNIRIPVGDSDVGLILQVFICDVEDNALQDIILSKEHQAYNWFTLAEVTEKLAVKYPLEFLRALEYIFEK